MVMIRRATGRIENVAEQQDTKEGVVVCKACSHIVFRVNLDDNKNCPFAIEMLSPRLKSQFLKATKKTMMMV